ncbi:MAG: hypothetical protein ACLR8P_01135 [Clostridium fessum]
MPVEDRAAQFASFAALNGYEEAVEEEARLTEREIDLDDSVREMINQTLVEAEEQLMRGETVRLSRPTGSNRTCTRMAALTGRQQDD